MSAAGSLLRPVVRSAAVASVVVTPGRALGALVRLVCLLVVVAVAGLVGGLWGGGDRAVAQSGGDAGLVAAFGFEEPSGRSVVDSSTAGNDGMLDGASRSGTGRFGRALSFDGDDDMVSVPDADSLDLDEGMTLEAWVNPRVYEGWQTALVKERPGGLSYALSGRADGEFPIVEVVTDSDGAQGVRGDDPLPTGQWSHLAGSYDGQTLRLYVDGELVDSSQVDGSLEQSDGGLRIGASTVSPDEAFDGLIDEVRVYDRPLSASEIGEDMRRPVIEGPPPEPAGELVAAYGFEEVSGAAVTDSSSFGNDGTAAGATRTDGGRFGRAFSFDGDDDIVSVPDADSLDLAEGMTLEAWVNPRVYEGWRTAVLKERPGGLAYALYARSDGEFPMVDVTSSEEGPQGVRGDDPLPVGQWSHLAATYDGQTLRLYVNGTLIDSSQVAGSLVQSDGALRIGASEVFGDEDFDGLIDEVRIYSRALGQEEIERDRDRPVVAGTEEPGAPDADNRIGLEQWWSYGSTDTGAGTQAHVNLSTGNLVWHATPISNPGRGLSTLVNLTYNSHQRRPRPLQETPVEQGRRPYAEAGAGFSLGVSSLTRVNEPLNVDLADQGRITLTDPDGTFHLFRAEAGTANEVYRSPRGVQLHLRRFSAVAASSPPGAGFGEAVLVQPERAWAATRPDGTTHFFDQRGYQTSVEDRNGNRLTFNYEYRSASRQLCQDAQQQPVFPLAAEACARKLVSVTNPGGLQLQLSYEPRRVADIPQAWIPDTGLPPELQGVEFEPAGYASGRVAAITDHADRVTRLAYDAEGRLERITEAADTAQPRASELRYDPVQAPLSVRPLSRVIDPRGNTTRFDYEPRAGGDSLTDALLFDRRIAGVTDRSETQASGPATGYAFVADPDGSSQATVTDTRQFATQYRFDVRGRMVELTDPRSAITRVVWDDAATNDNNVAQVTEAAGTGDEAVIALTHNANGEPLSQDAPEGRRTELSYLDSDGPVELRSQRERTPGVSIDAGRGFVSDLATLTTPKGTASPTAGDFTTRFAYDAAGRGNVVQTTDPEGNTAEASYGQFGLLTEEVDEVDNVTRYQDHDPNGQPSAVIDPRDKVWRYCYDPVGNLTRATDPRGQSQHNCTPGNRPYSTTTSYDALDRPVEQISPKRSADAVFVTRGLGWDLNDNLVSERDGNNAVTDTTYTAMDRPEEIRSPEVSHVDADGREVTRQEWDSEENLRKLTGPQGTRTATGDDFTSTFAHDAVNQLVVERRLARGPVTRDLVSSYAHDLRGNMVGLVDPRRNEQGGDPVANAADPAKRRYSLEYDKADRLVAEVEDPVGLGLRTAYGYDLNDNRDTVTNPRGTATPEPGDFQSRTEFDQRDLALAEIDAEGRRTAIERRGDGKVTAVTKPKGTATPEAPGDYQTRFAYFPTGELRQRTIPHAANQYGSNSLAVDYQINDVGDPTTVTDAAGRQITNSFLDSGELASTNRPSWWKLQGDRLTERAPGEIGGSPRETRLPGSEGQGDLGAVSGPGAPDLMPLSGQTQFGYDDELRLTSITDAGGRTVSMDRDRLGRLLTTSRPIDETRNLVERYAYDFNGNLARTTDADEHQTTTAYDQFDRVIAQTRPGSNQGPETTAFTLDASGNQTAIQTPRGTVWQQAFDPVDRLASRTDPETGVTSYEYDRAGNRSRITSPRGNALPEADRAPYRTRFEYNEVDELTTRIDGLGHEWRYNYDLNGNRIRTDAPPIARNPEATEQRQVTTRTYEGRDLLWTETTGRADNGEDRRRTRVWEFDPNRQLRRMVNPNGVDQTAGLPNFAYTTDGQVSSSPDAAKHATVYEYEAASDPTLLTSVRLAWGDRDANDQNRYAQRFGHDDRGRVNTIDPPQTGASDPQARTTYTHYATGWIRTADDRWQTFDYDYDRRGLQRLWKVRDKQTQRVREIERAHWPSGLTSTRTGHKTLESGREIEYTYRYQHNPNRSLTKLIDERLDRETTFGYDLADRQTQADEVNFQVGEQTRRGKDTRLAYNLDGDVTSRRTDGRIATDGTYVGGKTTSFSYDPLGREQSMEVTAPDEATRRTFSDYWNGGELRSRRTERAASTNDTVERWFRYSDSRISRLDRKRQGATEFAKNHNYSYDLNGNRTSDERGSHAYNARDQLVQWTKPSEAQVDYILNGSGGITRRSEGDTSTVYNYFPGGERLQSAVTTNPGGSLQTDYRYDEGFGDVTSFGTPGQPAQATFTYDPFGRLRTTVRGGNQTDYTYDGLDRRDTRTGETRTFDYSYVGLSESLSQEQQFGGDERRSFDYSSTMERLGTARKTTATSTAPYRAYSKDANGSVEGLEDQTGAIPASDRYQYDPYGALAGGEAGLSGDARANSFRFQGHHYDPANQTYDIQARAYLPETGRFLQEDHYEDAEADQALETSVTTNDRYTLLGGDPVSQIEFDGHIAYTSGPNSADAQVQGGDTIDREQGVVTSGPDAGTGAGGSDFEAPPSPTAGATAPVLDAATQASNAETIPIPAPPTRPAKPPALAASPCSYGRGGTPASSAPGSSNCSSTLPPTGGGSGGGLQTALAGCSVAPVVGIPCDLAGGVVSAAQGDLVGAGLSAGGIFFEGASGAKLGRNLARQTDQPPSPAATEGPPRAGASALEDASQASSNAAEGPINISRKHLPGAGGRYNKFAEGVDVDGVVREGLRSPNAMFRPNPGGGYRVDTDLGRAIGQSGRRTVRSIVSPDGRVITAFPYGPKRP